MAIDRDYDKPDPAREDVDRWVVEPRTGVAA